ncbi:MAG: hypothetical protein HY644_07175 [Acidobacteria bacterium]|nr:hypothetical protein [Acidobacteriota bacterium]
MLASLHQAEAGQTIDICGGLQLVNKINKSLKEDVGLVMLATDRTQEFSISQRSANVSIIACSIAQTLVMPESTVIRVTLAGLLRDIGIVRTPTKLLYKQGAFSDSEKASFRQIPIYSAEILDGISGFEWLSPVVRQVYEREDGTGYPFGLAGKQIAEEAKVLGIAIVWEAFLHRRSDRDALTGHHAVEHLASQADGFPDRIVKALIDTFSVYPLNEYVVLNTHEVGKVIATNAGNPLRPIVKVLYSPDGERYLKPRIVNLIRNFQIYIRRAITWRELSTALEEAAKDEESDQVA